jgi:hypothetical protein
MRAAWAMHDTTLILQVQTGLTEQDKVEGESVEILPMTPG